VEKPTPEEGQSGEGGNDEHPVVRGGGQGRENTFLGKKTVEADGVIL